MKSYTQTLQKLITLDDVGFKNQHKSILERISFVIFSNSITTLLGHNGAGKTTLAKIILGILKPSFGKITCHKKVQFSYIPQKIHLYSILPITVERFIGLPKPVHKDVLMEALEKTNVSYAKDSQMSDLSGGELQRVLLARAITQKPDLFILDEPIQNVDASGQIELYQLISWLRDIRKASVVLISHDNSIASSLSNYVIHLEKGAISCVTEL